MRTHLLGLAAGTLWTTSVFAISDNDVRAAVEQRFNNDRTGACVAAAVIDNGTTASTYVCADPKSQRRYDEHTAFEIGSVTKTMTAALLAEFIARGEVTLNDPIVKLLPPGTSVPSFNGRQITIGDIVTHTSGLPSFPWRGTDRSNPYGSVTERDLLGTLAATQLTRAPGSQWEYSNFAMMVLSYGLAKHSGKGYETLLRERLLAPLGMNDTYVAERPPQVRLAQGHLSIAKPTVPWDFPANMAGVGGVRATLPDMLRYVEAELGTRESAITPVLARTQEQITNVGSHTMGMNWNLSTVNGRTIVEHGGATGGYRSFVAFEPAAKRAVVLLSDTALTDPGGLRPLGLHLLDRSVLIGAPRIVATADAKLIDALVGRYRLQSGLGMDLRHKGKALSIQADGQPEFEMGYDSVGDFYPLRFDALLRPKRKADGRYTFTWFQGGGALEAERIDTPDRGASLDGYVGTYKLADKFLLEVFRMNDGLFARATGQNAFPIFPSAFDEFFAKVAGISMSFTRDPNNAVNGLVLHQNGDRSAPKLGMSELPPGLREMDLDATMLGEYVGKYRFSFGVLDVALKNDHLDAQLTGQAAFPIFANAKDKFFYKVVDAQLDFKRDAGGKVIEVVLHQNGRDMRASRTTTEQRHCSAGMVGYRLRRLSSSDSQRPWNTLPQNI